MEKLYTNRVLMQHIKLADSNSYQPYIGCMNYKIESGRRLKKAREDKKLTLANLAKLTKTLGKSRISNYEQGLRFMDPEAAHQLARVLDVSAAYLMCVDDEVAATPEERDLLRRYRCTDPRGRKTILKIAEDQPCYNSYSDPERLAS